MIAAHGLPDKTVTRILLTREVPEDDTQKPTGGAAAMPEKSAEPVMASIKELADEKQTDASKPEKVWSDDYA